MENCTNSLLAYIVIFIYIKELITFSSTLFAGLILFFSPPPNTLMKMSDPKDEKEEEKTYGSCEGPNAMYVKLVSSDGHEFIVKRDHALTSGTIKAMLSGPGKFFLYFLYIWHLIQLSHHLLVKMKNLNISLKKLKLC